MRSVFKYLLLDSSRSDEEKELLEKANKLNFEEMFSTAKGLTEDIIFQTLFEEPHEDLITEGSIKDGNKKIEFEVILRDSFYHKHIGKYMDSQRILDNLDRKLKKGFDETCWKKIARGGGCDGHCK
jgi:hypothetical protein